MSDLQTIHWKFPWFSLFYFCTAICRTRMVDIDKNKHVIQLCEDLWGRRVAWVRIQHKIVNVKENCRTGFPTVKLCALLEEIDMTEPVIISQNLTHAQFIDIIINGNKDLHASPYLCLKIHVMLHGDCHSCRSALDTSVHLLNTHPNMCVYMHISMSIFYSIRRFELTL